jgi:ATP:cob(I)alamin adenosyltransferase
MKIYTKTGDEGQTGLFGGPRVRKDDVRIEAYGTVDELNAAIGLARCQPLPPAIDQCLLRVQSELFSVGAELATPDPQKHGTTLVGERQIAALEASIDQLEETLPPLKNFILPGGSPAAAMLHVARGICRRAERRVVTLASQPKVAATAHLIRYLNRLGDYLFVAARSAGQHASIAEIPWEKPAS